MLRAVLAVAAAGAAVLIYASLVERTWWAVRRHRLPCLPPGSAPLTILHVSDLHMRPGQRRKCRFIASLGSLAPDLAVATGDLLEDDRGAEAVVEALSAIRARLGGVFVLGSHDYFRSGPKIPLGYLRARRGPAAEAGRTNERLPEMIAGLERAGWRLASNLAFETGGIDIAGLDDPYLGRDDLSVASPRAREGFRLALVHAPDPARALAARGFDLILAGHTHGGQLRVPGIGALVTNSTVPRRWARGVHSVDGAWLHVSAGLGTSVHAPVRFACRPEACLLELVARVSDERSCGCPS
ncbi:MAG: metallophosphoesterase [Acidobacteria bacterium]|nr:metallophosphoesterase [Acidobacteriota bacterium]